MIIDYFDSPAKDLIIFTRDEVPKTNNYDDDNALSPEEKEGITFQQSSGEFPHATIHRKKEKRTQKIERRGIFRKRYVVEDISFVPDAKIGYSILGAAVEAHPYENFQSKLAAGVAIDEFKIYPEKRLYINRYGLPIIKKVITPADALLLLQTDPRYIRFIDPELFIHDDVKKVGESIILGLDRILSSQAKFKVPFSQEEMEERTRFAAEIEELYKEFERNYQNTVQIHAEAHKQTSSDAILQMPKKELDSEEFN